jgi:hypothetical protein
MSLSPEISADDLIYYKEGDKIYSGGFQVNSILLKKGLSPLTSYQHAGSNNENKVSDLFKNFAIPSGLLYYPNKSDYGSADIIVEKDYIVQGEFDDDEYMTEDIHDRLLELASANKQGGSRRKRKRKIGTKKNRK